MSAMMMPIITLMSPMVEGQCWIVWCCASQGCVRLWGRTVPRSSIITGHYQLVLGRHRWCVPVFWYAPLNLPKASTSPLQSQ